MREQSGDGMREQTGEGIPERSGDGDDLIGRVLPGDIEVLRFIGEGGMGRVYEAEQRSVGRRVALKVLAPVYAKQPAAVRRFAREARAMCRLNHPAIATVYTFDRVPDDGLLFYVMELIDGRTLKQVLDEDGPLGVERACELLAQVCAGLHHAHVRNVVHRDLKPENIMVFVDDTGRECAKVLDFGLAAIAEADTGEPTHQSAPHVIGTPPYMAPEVILGRAPTPATDLYAAGVTLYELLTGRRPFRANTYAAVFLEHINTPPPPLPTPLPSGETPPQRLALLVAQLLAKAPNERPPTAWEVSKTLRRLFESAASTGSSRVRVFPGAPLPRSSSGDQTSRPPASTVSHAPTQSTAALEPVVRDVVVVVALVDSGGDGVFSADPDAWDAHLQHIDARWRDVATGAGTVVVQPLTGDGYRFEAVAGLGPFGEQAPQQGLRVALALQQELANISSDGLARTTCRIGVAVGRVQLEVSCQDGQRVRGPAVVEAQRLAELAAAGEILASDALWAVASDFADAERLPEDALAVRLLKQPVWRLTQLHAVDSGAPRRVHGLVSPLVGRDETLGNLQRFALEAIEQRKAATARILGGPGMGKSRLLHELRRWLNQRLGDVCVYPVRIPPRAAAGSRLIAQQILRVLWPRVTRDDSAALRNAIEAATGSDAGASGSPAHALAIVAGLDGTEDEQEGAEALATRAGEALGLALRKASGSAFPVVLLDDVHRCDRLGIATLQAMTSVLAKRACLVVATARPDPDRPASRACPECQETLTIALERLPDEAIEKLVHGLLGTQHGQLADVVDLIIRRAGGNPLVAEEWVRALLSHRVLEPSHEGWKLHPQRLAGLGNPVTVRALWQSVLDGLPEDERTILRAAAVVGEAFWDTLVRQLVASPFAARLGVILGRLELRGLVLRMRTSRVPSAQEFRFAHPALREAALERVRRAKRPALHARIAAWARVQANASDMDAWVFVAQHYEWAHAPLDAARAWLEAARAASKHFAFDSALAWAHKARTLAVTAAEAPASRIVEVAADQLEGDIHLHLAAFDEAAKAFQQGLARSDGTVDDEIQAELARGASRAHYRAGRAETALSLLEELRGRVDPHSPTFIALHADVAWALYQLARFDEAEAQVRAGIDQAQRGWMGGGDRRERWLRAVANCYTVLGTLLLGRGHPAEAMRAYGEARAHFLRAEARTAATSCELNMGIAMLRQGDPGEALVVLDNVIAEMTTQHYDHGVANARIYRAQALAALGRRDEAATEFEAALAWARARRISVIAGEALAGLAALERARGNTARAVELASEAVEAVSATEVAEARGAVLAEFGRCLLAAGRPAEARQALREALAQCKPGFLVDLQREVRELLDEID